MHLSKAVRLACAVATVILVGFPLAAAPTPPANPLRLILPPEIQAVVGHETNLYFDNVVLSLSSAAYAFDVTCAKGTQQQERWTFVAQAGDVGSHDLKLEVRDAANKVIASATTKVRVIAANAGADRPVTGLIIGDSLTHASVYPEELLTLCKAPGNPRLTLIGTHHLNGTSPGNKHEGYGGWTAARFATFFNPNAKAPGDSSPFVFGLEGKPRLNFRRYLARTNDGVAPDFITILLGCNDNFGASDATIEASIDTMFANLDLLLKEFHSVRADTRIGLLLLPPPAASQDAFGANYACGQTRWQYRRNQHRVVERTIATYGGREKEFIYLVPDNVNLDAVHNYPAATVPVNGRNAEKVTRQANGCHPSAEGYRQIADSVYCWLKGGL
jgi:lysophospholipase L1-like esterase